MKKIIALLAFAIVVTACGSNSDGVVKIAGKISNVIPQGEVILEKYEVGEITPVETVYSDHNGNFEMEVTIDGPGFYRLNLYGQQFELLVLGNDDLSIEAEGQSGGLFTVSGSEVMDHVQAFYEELEGFQSTVVQLNQQFLTARNEGKTELMTQLQEQYMEMEKEQIKTYKTMAYGYDKSLASILIAQEIQKINNDQFTFLDSLATKLKRELPESPDVEFFATNLELLRPAVVIGDIAPDITLPNPDGETMSLSDLRGKYVLLDFWAGWCRPCRMENPNVVNMYNKYNDDGFEVFSVSLDRTRNQWVNAIEKDGLVWPGHVSDLKYFQSAAAMKYKVNAIPFALLLDPEGRVIGKNLRGRALQAKLASIFGEQ